MKTNTQTDQAGAPETQKPVRGVPIETEMGKLNPSLSHDTAGGQAINGGYLSMGSEAATCTVKRGGEKHLLRIIHTLNGTIEVASEFRTFELDLSKFVQHAIDNGLLEPTMDFAVVKG